jgi:hypothetical protein
MASEWAAVDDLMRELGSLRSAADAMRVPKTAHDLVERVIADAAEAVNHTIDRPRNAESLTQARDALGLAEEVVLALDLEIGRSLRVRSRAAHLRERAATLVRASGEIVERQDQLRRVREARRHEE